MNENKNKLIVAEALMLYTDAMRRFIQARLQAQYQDSWWQRGVMPSLSTAQRPAVERAAKADPERAKIDCLDANHFEAVVIRHFNGAFGGVFGEHKKAQFNLRRAAIARNESSAHAASGDVAVDEAASALEAMGKLLRAAQQPEAERVEVLRNALLGISEPAALSIPLQATIAAHSAASATLSVTRALEAKGAAVSAGTAALDVQASAPAHPLKGEPHTEGSRVTGNLPQETPSLPQPLGERGPGRERAGDLPYWRNVCVPHPAFQNPRAIDISLFAATLGAVVAGAARPEYQDPRLFFTATYFTQNLKLIVHDVAERLAGRGGTAVTEMQTPFGGGKTHALLTLYHLVNSPRESLSVPGVAEALGDLPIPPGAQVLAFDGNEFGADETTKEDGTPVSTLWGELAYQIDAALYRREVQQCDTDRVAPGNAIYRRVLQAASPCLILIDEVTSYLLKLKNSGATRGTKLYQQTLIFLQELLQEAGNVPGVSVLISLPKSQRELGNLNPEEIKRLMERTKQQELQAEVVIAEELHARADRVVEKRTPVNDDELYTLIARRLFQQIDAGAARRVAQAYREVYQGASGLLEQRVLSAEYAAKIEQAYPLHPELIDVLERRWTSDPDVPRTRAMLQFLAGIVADQWIDPERESYTIQPAHVNLERDELRNRARGANEGWEAVIKSDVAGADSNAGREDLRRGDLYQRRHITRGIATTLLLHSIGGSQQGATTADLRLGTIAPNVGVSYVDNVLEPIEHFEEKFWYVYRPGGRLRFQTRINIYRKLAQAAGEVPQQVVDERLRQEMQKAKGEAPGFIIYEAAGSANEPLPDQPRAAIAILDPRYRLAGNATQARPEGFERIVPLWERAGGGFRQFRNALILVAADADRWEQVDKAVREVIAYEGELNLAKKAGASELSPGEIENLKSRHRDRSESLRASITSAYRWLCYPEREGLDWLQLPDAVKGETIAGRAVKRLESNDYGQPKILRAMAPVYFSLKIAPEVWQDEQTGLDLAELSRRFLQWTYLPLLPEREATLKACLLAGTGEKWAVAVGDAQARRYEGLLERAEQVAGRASLFDGMHMLVRGQLWETLRQRFAPPASQPDAALTADGVAITQAGTAGLPVRDAVAGEYAAAAAAAPAATRPAAATTIIPRPERHGRVRLQVAEIPVAKTNNLQLYLFKMLQQADPSARVSLTITVQSDAGMAAETLDRSIVEGLEQLGIRVSWSTE